MSVLCSPRMSLLDDGYLHSVAGRICYERCRSSFRGNRLSNQIADSSVRLFCTSEMLTDDDLSGIDETIARAIEGEEGKEAPPIYQTVIAAVEKSRNPIYIDLGGIDTTNYKKNPIVLYNHDDGDPFILGLGGNNSGIPVARAVNIGMDMAGRVVSRFQFLPGDAFASRIENAWSQGFLRGASIRILPLEIEEMNEGEDIKITKSDLLEWSIVTIPADADAVYQSIKNKLGGKKKKTYASINISGTEYKIVNSDGSSPSEVSWKFSEEPESKEPENKTEEPEDKTGDELTQSINSLKSAVVDLTDMVKQGINSITSGMSDDSTRNNAQGSEPDPDESGEALSEINGELESILSKMEGTADA